MVYRESETQRPGLGAIVWVRTEQWPDGPHTDCAAIVTRILPTGNVDVSVFESGRSEMIAMYNVVFDAS